MIEPVDDGQHRHSSRPGRLNTPRPGNCFFCFRNKPNCTVVTLPQNTVEQMQETAKDDLLLLAIIQRLSKSQFVCCPDCLDKKEVQAEAIVNHMFALKMEQSIKN